MTQEPKNGPDPFLRGLRNLDHLRRFTGPPGVFWPSFLQSLVSITGARLGVLLRKAGDETAPWQRMGVWPSEGVAGNGAQFLERETETLANSCLQQGQTVRALDGSEPRPTRDCGVAVRLASASSQEAWVAAFYLPGCSESQAANALKQLLLLAHTPGIYHLQQTAQQNQVALSHFSSVLDLMALLNAERRFLAIAMTFCNELASRHKCDRVSLGWLQHESIRLQAISHTERFDRKMEAVRALEQTMEEALDQDEVLVWPPAEGEAVVTRDHGRFAEDQKVKFLCSVPLRLGGEAVGVILCERNSEPFSDLEVRLLGLYCEMATRRLSELKRSDQWFGARAAAAARESLAKAVGVEHTWAKVLAISVAVALGVLFFGRMTYRVEAPFIVRTEDLALLSAPFNGFIDEVAVEVGDAVQPRKVLLKLDTRDLLLEEGAALADLERYLREAEKARATNALAEMRIAQAEAEQARVRLESVRYHLDQAALTAPFDGVIVEGDLKKRIAAPVKQGDLLFKVARTDRMYVECSVKENDIHEVRGDATGEIAFTSQPRLKFPVRVVRIEPVAQTKDQKNVFIVRCRFQTPVKGWWRPGMSGVAKLNVGPRTFFWIISHRTVDFLRMYFWL